MTFLYCPLSGSTAQSPKSVYTARVLLVSCPAGHSSPLLRRFSEGEEQKAGHETRVLLYISLMSQTPFCQEGKWSGDTPHSGIQCNRHVVLALVWGNYHVCLSQFFAPKKCKRCKSRIESEVFCLGCCYKTSKGNIRVLWSDALRVQNVSSLIL